MSYLSDKKVRHRRTRGDRMADPTDAEKDPQTWVTGEEPATGPQKSYLATLARETGAEVPEELTKAEASEQIEQLRQRSDRVES
jgi:hypothetical protein